MSDEYRIFFVAPKSAEFGARSTIIIAVDRSEAVNQSLSTLHPLIKKEDDLVVIDLTDKYAEQGFKISITRDQVSEVLH